MLLVEGHCNLRWASHQRHTKDLTSRLSEAQLPRATGSSLPEGTVGQLLAKQGLDILEGQKGSVHGRTYIVDVLGRLSRFGLGCRRGAALRQQHRACAALHIVRREDRLHMRFGQQVSSYELCME